MTLLLREDSWTFSYILQHARASENGAPPGPPSDNSAIFAASLHAVPFPHPNYTHYLNADDDSPRPGFVSPAAARGPRARARARQRKLRVVVAAAVKTSLLPPAAAHSGDAPGPSPRLPRRAPAPAAACHHQQHRIP